jgi:hypothetical protein
MRAVRVRCAVQGTIAPPLWRLSLKPRATLYGLEYRKHWRLLTRCNVEATSGTVLEGLSTLSLLWEGTFPMEGQTRRAGRRLFAHSARTAAAV